MRKKLLFALTTMVMTSIAFGADSFTTYAGQWQQEGNTWWYQNDDNSYPVNGWEQIDGNWYCFGGDGYLLTNTTTPDGYQVDSNGAWINNGQINSEQQNNTFIEVEKKKVEMPAGTYLVGQDLPAGQYVAVNDGLCYVKIGADPNMNTVYSSELTHYSIPFEVRDGDWVYSSKGMIYSIDNITLDLAKDGMYVVGVHIKAGDYRLEARGKGYYAITRGMLGKNDKIEKNANFDTVAYVSLKNGQCIRVSRCTNNFVAP